MEQGKAYGSFADCYDVLMHDVDYDAWAAYLCGWLHGGRVLECACGTGELTVRLKKRGYEITGVDLSGDMLRVAQKKAMANGVKIPFIQQDMQKVQMHRAQDAVICACDGVNYLTSKKSVSTFFERVYQLLRPDGVFLFDVSSRYKLENVLDGTTFGEDMDQFAYLCQNVYDEQAKLLEMNLTVFARQGERYDCFRERHVQRAHSEQELRNALTECGFQDIGVYEAFQQTPVREQSERIQFVAYKRG